jgi:glycosyltransferase involved in cell wall biosynthesis
MAGELVSVIMPAYNAEKYIAESIRSVLAQTYPGWELIVVDDGSRDNTGGVVREFVARDSRIKYIFQENGRLGKARNTGLKNVSGELIAFLDSDDLWIGTKLAAQMRALSENEADVVFSDCYVFNDENTANERTRFGSFSGRFSGSELLDRLICQNRIPVLTVMLKRTLLDRVGVFEEGKPYHGLEDYDLWLR